MVMLKFCIKTKASLNKMKYMEVCMEKVRVNYEKMYYGFPIILVSYYDRQ